MRNAKNVREQRFLGNTSCAYCMVYVKPFAFELLSPIGLNAYADNALLSYEVKKYYGVSDRIRVD